MSEKNKELLLVSGDFSGIQDTVYTISSQGALKSLRARSFMLELLTEHIVYEILQMPGMPTDKPEEYLIRLMPENINNKTGVIYSGGGKFSLLLSYNDKLESQISKFADTLNNWAFEEFTGKLFIAVHVLTVSSNDLQGQAFLNARQKQADELDKLKQRKFWTENGSLLEKLLTPEMPKQLNNEKECQITRRDDLPDDKMEKLDDMQVSSLSYHLWHLGDKLTKLKQGKEIYRFNYYDAVKKAGHGFVCFPKNNGTDYALYTLENISNISPEKYWTLGKDFFYAYYVRKIGHLPGYAQDAELKAARETMPEKVSDKKDIQDHTASFTGLAVCSCGADMIGALQMDVDSLGSFILSNLLDSPRKLALFSHQLNYFFKNIMNQICKCRTSQITFNECVFSFNPVNILKKDYSTGRNVSVIYAGGDDLFIIGAWNEVAELAYDIQTCFKAYCETINDKEGLKLIPASISGGLTIHHPKLPLYQMAEKSREAIKFAKNDIDDIHEEKKKNRIALFYDESKKQHKHRLTAIKQEKKTDYMLSMTWDTGREFLLQLMADFMELGEPGSNGQRDVFVIDRNKLSYQTIEKWFRVIQKFQQSDELYLPTMARVLRDVQENLSRSGQKELFVRLQNRLYENAEQNISHLHIALNWLSFLRRTR